MNSIFKKGPFSFKHKDPQKEKDTATQYITPGKRKVIKDHLEKTSIPFSQTYSGTDFTTTMREDLRPVGEVETTRYRMVKDKQDIIFGKVFNNEYETQRRAQFMRTASADWQKAGSVGSEVRKRQKK